MTWMVDNFSPYYCNHFCWKNCPYMTALLCVIVNLCNLLQGASVNRAIFQNSFFLVRQQWGGCRYQCVKLLNGVKLNWKYLNSFTYTLCSYVLKSNKWKHFLFMAFLRSPDSLMHPVLQHKRKVLLELWKYLRSGIFENRVLFQQLLFHSISDSSRFPTAVCWFINNYRFNRRLR
jgi:hypothetical protein